MGVLLYGAAHVSCDKSVFQKNEMLLSDMRGLLFMCNLCAKCVAKNGSEDIKHNY